MSGQHHRVVLRSVSRRSVLLGVTAAAVAAALAGCASDSKFANVDAWEKKLHLGEAGKEILRDYHGSNSGLGGDHPTLMLLVQGAAATVEAPVLERLEEFSFTKDSESDYWTSRAESETRTLAISLLESGQSAYFPQHDRRVKVARDSVLFKLTVDD